MSYIEATESQRLACKIFSKEAVPKLGKRLPICVKMLDELLPLLANVACCTWKCPGGKDPHILEHLVGKSVSQTLAGIELSLSGHYDEALLLARAVGEAANLAWLFWLAPESFDKWCNSSDRDRWNNFRPAKVRRMIMSHGIPAPIDENRYSILSSSSTHPTPHATPQNFNREMPTLGGFYQEAGLIASLNELAAPISVVGSTSARLLKNFPKDKVDLIIEKSASVLRNIGGLDLERSIQYVRK